MPINEKDPRYVKTEALWHLVKDYYEFTGSKAGELVTKIALNSRGAAAFLTYGTAEDCARSVLKSQSFISGVKMGLETFAADESEKDALCAVLTAIADVLEGDSAAYESSRSYPAAVAAIQSITPSDPAVYWSKTSDTFFWVINEWIDEVPILVEYKNGRWVWSLSRGRGQGIEATRDAAMRAGEKALGWSEKPFKEKPLKA